MAKRNSNIPRTIRQLDAKSLSFLNAPAPHTRSVRGIPQTNAGKSNVDRLVQDTVQGAARFVTPPAPSGSPIQDTARFAGFVGQRGAQAFTAPVSATGDLLSSFARDVQAGLQKLVTGITDVKPPDTQFGRFQGLQKKYGPVVGSGLGIAQGLSEGGGALATGMAAGSLYNAAQAGTLPTPGMYVEDVQRTRLSDPNTETQDLVQDHTDYHQQLGRGSEQPNMSMYHDDLAKELARRQGLPEPVLPEDYAKVFQNAADEYSAQTEGFPTRETKLPMEKTTPGAPPIAERTPAQSEAIYRWEGARTFSADDQWKSFLDNVSKDLRRAGIEVDVSGLTRGGAAAEDFGSRLLEVAPKEAAPIADAWAEETANARDMFQALKSGKPLPRFSSSPVQALQDSVFGDASSVNADVAEGLRETAGYYANRGDVFRAKAYNRAADLVTTKGAPDLSTLPDAGAIQDAFGRQGGIGPQISQHIADFVKDGSFPELDALRKAVPNHPGGAAFANEDFNLEHEGDTPPMSQSFEKSAGKLQRTLDAPPHEFGASFHSNDVNPSWLKNPTPEAVDFVSSEGLEATENGDLTLAGLKQKLAVLREAHIDETDPSLFRQVEMDIARAGGTSAPRTLDSSVGVPSTVEMKNFVDLGKIKAFQKAVADGKFDGGDIKKFLGHEPTVGDFLLGDVPQEIKRLKIVDVSPWGEGGYDTVGHFSPEKPDAVGVDFGVLTGKGNLSRSPNQVANTLLHEIAHYLDPAAEHGASFRALLKAIKQTGRFNKP